MLLKPTILRYREFFNGWDFFYHEEHKSFWAILVPSVLQIGAVMSVSAQAGSVTGRSLFEATGAPNIKFAVNGVKNFVNDGLSFHG